MCTVDVQRRSGEGGTGAGWPVSEGHWVWTGKAGVKIPFPLVSFHHWLRSSQSHGDYSARQIQSKSLSSCSEKRKAKIYFQSRNHEKIHQCSQKQHQLINVLKIYVVGYQIKEKLNPYPHLRAITYI